MQELTDAIRLLANGKTVGSDGTPVKLFRIILNIDSALRRKLLQTAVCIWTWGGGGTAAAVEICPRHGILQKRGRTECGNYRGIAQVEHACKILLNEDYRSQLQ